MDWGQVPSVLLAAALLGTATGTAFGQNNVVPLGPMVAPPENPITTEKALLGKFLFWEEQLSSDDSTACGTCHIPEAGGSDPRSMSGDSIHPGPDFNFGTSDDVRGSIGVVRVNVNGDLIDEEPFGERRQVTGRRSMPTIGAGYSDRLFWDGRADDRFVDPQTGDEVIRNGAALENQALAPVLSDVEMGHVGRTWDDAIAKLSALTPMALARDLPADMQEALTQFGDYPAFFEMAFGTPEISARRIAFAIATYERTQVPDQTPYDRFARGDADALTTEQRQGLQLIQQNCGFCHGGPDFSDHNFRHTGVRPVEEGEDLGLFEVTGRNNDRGEFKISSLRNVKLRPPFFHDGGKVTLEEVVDFYSRGGDFREDVSPFFRPRNFSAIQTARIVEFMEVGLTDPRVEAGAPPFDHPTLQTFFRRGDANSSGVLDIVDAMVILFGLFRGSQAMVCDDAADADDNGRVELVDAIAVLRHLFLVGVPLPEPGARTPGPDPTADALDCAEVLTLES